VCPTVIAVCGEALVDLVPADPASRRFDALPGGSPANTAVALARLGVPAMLLARLSEDGFGRLLREHFASSGVDLSRAVVAAEPSSLAVVAVGADGDASYRFDIAGTADWQWADAELGPLPEHVRAVHAGSLALSLPPGGAVLERFLSRARGRCTVSVDPNLRAGLLPDLDATRAAVLRWLTLADVVKASTGDLALLHPGEDPERVVRNWARLGPGLVVLTRAGQGALAVLARTGEVVRRPAVPVTVVDTVGAGDTFTAGMLGHLHGSGLLGGRLDGLGVEQVAAALDRALRAAAVTCGRAGADPPYAREL